MNQLNRQCRSVRAALLLSAIAAGTPPGATAQGVGAIEGRVITVGGQPAAGAEIRIAEIGRLVRARDDGRFSILDVPPGQYLVEASSTRWGRAIQRVLVTAGHPTQLVVELVPTVHLDEIIVSAGVQAQRQSEAYQATKVLSQADLSVQAANTLGETLADEPGVSASYFGPGSSRPVIRGLSGDRVRVLEGGVGSGDASNTSPDHAVSVEPLTAERIEVIRGPATLLYGSAAIGGVVNVLDGRIPRERPTRPIAGTLRVHGATGATERSGAASLTASLGPIVLNGSALRRVTGDYGIPGAALVDPLPGTTPSGVLDNTALTTTRVAIGGSVVTDAGYLGISASRYDSEYGVPARPLAGAEPDPVSIDLLQQRFDLEGTWRFPTSAIRSTRLRFGLADYEHVELEGTEVGTRFLNYSWEARLEAVHGGVGPLTGAVGLQVSDRDFSAIGDEAFVPPTSTAQYAAFLFEELDLGPVRVQLGGRYERQEATNEETDLALDREGVSFSAGVNWTVVEALAITLNGGRSVKLPTPEELFSNGPHLATSAYEVGNAGLTREVALSTELGLHLDAGPVHAAATGYVTAFDDFIFQRFTGGEREGLREVAFAQQDARFLGFEIETTIEVLHRTGHHLTLHTLGDLVRAELSDENQPLPRIPPARYGGGARYEGDRWTAHVDVTRVTAQTRLGPFETATAGYTMVSASLGYRLFTARTVHELTLRGTNLADRDARNHVSFLKDVAPMPGRDIALTYRLSF